VRFIEVLQNNQIIFLGFRTPIKCFSFILLYVVGVVYADIQVDPTAEGKNQRQNDLAKVEEDSVQPPIFSLLPVDNLEYCVKSHNDKGVDKDHNHPDIKVPAVEPNMLKGLAGR
jgi:hypothetical protein